MPHPVVTPSAIFLAFVVVTRFMSAAHCLPVDPNATVELVTFDPANITFVAETVISVPVEVSPPRDKALARLGARAPPAGPIQTMLEADGDILAPIGAFFQRLLDSWAGRPASHHQPVPAL
jgi:hypothetical protein